MNRRQFLGAAGLASTGQLLAARSGAGQTGREAAMSGPVDPGSLQATWTSVDGLRMYSLVSVEAVPPGAPALVLVHGSGLSGQYMIPTARELTADFRVFVPDMPGFGNSGDPGAVLRVPQLADWLVKWMAAIGLERASFLGNSFGCQVIADLAARYPQRVEHVILQGPTTPREERSGFWQFIRWRQNQPYNPAWLGDVTRKDYEKAGFWRMVRSFMFQISDRIEDKMPAIQAPVLLVSGEHDPITPPDWCESLARLSPRGELVVIPGVAHTMVATAPRQLAEATRAFIMRASAGGTEPSQS